MKNQSFWERESFSRPYDLIVIGAGIVGLSSALFYSQKHPDARILVLDKGAIPEGASTRNAGFACVGSITEHVADMDKETEENIKKRLLRRYRGLQKLRETLGDETIRYENCGGYELFTDEAKFENARQHIPRFNTWMSELTGESDVYRADTLNGYPVIANRLEGALHPGHMMEALVRKVQQADIAVRWNTAVERIEDGGVVLLASGDEMTGRQVLAATNGFTRRLLPECGIVPARGYIMVSEPWEQIPWKGTFSYDRGYVYFRHLGDRLLLGGGRNVARKEESVDQFGSNNKIRNYLQELARQTLRMPAEVGFEYGWSGIMGFTRTKTPVLKRIDDHRVVAAGLSGMGIAISTEVGTAAAVILDNNG